jgi:cytochrome c oxidase subunit III
MTNTESSQELKVLQSSVAMTVALISWGMMFATLFLGYFLVRFSSPIWPPVEIQDLPQLLPFLSTVCMLLSSLTYFFMEKKAFENPRLSKMLWLATVALGLAFLGCQWFVWAALKETGILVSNGMVPSMVYAFTWLHAAHIVLGLIGLFYVGHYVFTNRAQLTTIKLMNVGKFWHFLGVVWVIMYLLIFVI